MKISPLFIANNSKLFSKFEFSAKPKKNRNHSSKGELIKSNAYFECPLDDFRFPKPSILRPPLLFSPPDSDVIGYPMVSFRIL